MERGRDAAGPSPLVSPGLSAASKDTHPARAVTARTARSSPAPFARRVADRVLFIREGQIAEAGPTAQIFPAPQNENQRTCIQSIL